jgi:ComF family protein
LNNRLKFKHIFNSMLQQACMLCANHNGGEHGLCSDCLQSLPWHTAPKCPQCGLLSDGLICGHCLQSAPSFDATHALFSYDYPLDRLLQHYKYKESLHLADTFSALFIKNLLDTAPNNHAQTDLVLPMPMHNERLKQRGFNQALEIARLISKHRQIKLDFTSCQRTRLTPPQASLPLKERIKNIRGVFECDKNLQGLNIALVDDVMTTGASLNELAKTLKQAGAAHVECWVIARTLPRPY